ncbi:unnamed protein product [Lupinus luteus]|uniref:Uncharacterized protein n=1 Tax=Lupinus luteus TaxID=3873 RepID=A0AAV1WVG0_LUPLU
MKEEAWDSVSQKLQHNGYSYGPQPQLVYQSQQIQGLANGSVGAVNALMDKMGIVYSNPLKYSEGELRRTPEMDYPQQYTHQYNSGSMLTSLVENNNNNGCVNEEHFRS